MVNRILHLEHTTRSLWVSKGVDGPQNRRRLEALEQHLMAVADIPFNHTATRLDSSTASLPQHLIPGHLIPGVKRPKLGELPPPSSCSMRPDDIVRSILSFVSFEDRKGFKAVSYQYYKISSESMISELKNRLSIKWSELQHYARPFLADPGELWQLCSRLTLVRLNETFCGNEAFRNMVRRCSEIRELVLWQTLSNDSLKQMAYLKNLERLHYNVKKPIPVETLGCMLEGWPKISALFFNGGWLRDAHVEIIMASKAKIKEVLFASPHIKDASIQKLIRACPQLTLLTISDNDHLTDQTVELAARSLPCLKYITLAQCSKVTDAALRAIGNHGGKWVQVDIFRCPQLSFAAIVSLYKQLPKVFFKDRPPYEIRTAVTDLVVLKVSPKMPALNIAYINKLSSPSMTIDGIKKLRNQLLGIIQSEIDLHPDLIKKIDGALDYYELSQKKHIHPVHSSSWLKRMLEIESKTVTKQPLLARLEKRSIWDILMVINMCLNQAVQQRSLAIINDSL